MPMENVPSAKIKEPQALAKGGYVVVRSNERKGKTHKVTAPDGSVKFFGDPNLKNRPNNPEAKASWYARHAKSLANNPHFRAYARSTWAEGGIVPDEVQYMQDGGFPDRVAGDTEELPLPEGLDTAPEELPMPPPEQLELAPQQPVAAAPSPVQVIVAQPQTPAPAEPVAQVQEVPASDKLEGLVQRVNALRFAPQKEYEKELPKLMKESGDLSGAERAEFANRLSGIQTGRAQLEKFTSQKPVEDAGRSPLGLLRKEVARAEKLGDEGYKKYQEVRKKSLEQLGGLRELLEDTPENQAANQEIIKSNRYRQEAANQIAEEIVSKPSALGEPPAAPTAPELPAKPTAPAVVQPAPVAAPIPAAPAAQPTTPAIAEVPAAPMAAAPAAPALAPAPSLGNLGVVAAGGVPVPAGATPTAPVAPSVPPQPEAPPELQYLVKPLERLAERSFGITDPAEKRNFAISELKRQGAITPTGAITPSVVEAERQSEEYKAAAQALDNERKAMLYKAELDGAAAKVKADVTAKTLELQAKQEQEYQIRSRTNAAQAQEIRQAIIDNKIDPKRFWNSMSTGSKVATGIGLLLGVIGKSLGGRGSVADFINSKIEEDVQQQYKDLDKKRSLLSNLIQEGNSIDDAFKMTTAYLQQIAAAQIVQQSANITDQQAKVAAQQAAAKFELDAAKTLNDILIKNLDKKYGTAKTRVANAGTNAIKILDLARIQRDYDEMERKAQEGKARGAIAGRKVAVSEAAEKRKSDEAKLKELAKDANPTEQTVLSGELVKTSDLPKIRKDETRKLLVPVYDPKTGKGHPVFRQAAYSATDAEKLRDTQIQVDSFMEQLAVLKELAVKYPTGIFETTNAADYRRAKDAEDAIIPLLGKITDLGVLQKSDYDILRGNIPSLTKWRPLVGQESTAQALKDYESRFQNVYTSKRNALLINPLAKEPAKALFRQAGQ